MPWIAFNVIVNFTEFRSWLIFWSISRNSLFSLCNLCFSELVSSSRFFLSFNISVFDTKVALQSSSDWVFCLDRSKRKSLKIRIEMVLIMFVYRRISREFSWVFIKFGSILLSLLLVLLFMLMIICTNVKESLKSRIQQEKNESCVHLFRNCDWDSEI